MEVFDEKVDGIGRGGYDLRFCVCAGADESGFEVSEIQRIARAIKREVVGAAFGSSERPKKHRAGAAPIFRPQAVKSASARIPPADVE